MTVDIVLDNERTPLLEPPGGDATATPSESSSPLVRTPSNDSESAVIRKEGATPKSFPWRPVISIFLLVTVQPVAYELIFPFVNQMIVENGIVRDPERVGFYSGIIESSFSLMSFVAIIPCSIASDHLGRKPILLVGTLGLAISIALFGMSKTYGEMIATRCIGGTLGGTIAALRVMLAEVTDKSQAGLAFGGFAIAYRMGQIVGQPIGGALSHPERHFEAFNTPFWNKYPFALPCFIASSFAVFALIFAYIFTEETLPSKRSKKTPSISRSQNVRQNSTQDISKAKQGGWRHYFDRSMYTPHLLSVLTCTMNMALSSEMIFALYPLFAFTPISSGGLGLSEGQIGVHLAFRALNNVVVMMFYTPLHQRLGAVRTLQFSMVFWPISVALFPLLNLMARRGAIGTLGFNVMVGTFFTAWSFAGICWSAMGIVTNDASPSASALSTVNSIGQMLTSLCLGIAPAFVTSLFAFSIKSQIANGSLVWLVMFVIVSMGALQSLTLKEPAHDWREEHTDNE